MLHDRCSAGSLEENGAMEWFSGLYGVKVVKADDVHILQHSGGNAGEIGILGYSPGETCGRVRQGRHEIRGDVVVPAVVSALHDDDAVTPRRLGQGDGVAGGPEPDVVNWTCSTPGTCSAKSSASSSTGSSRSRTGKDPRSTPAAPPELRRDRCGPGGEERRPHGSRCTRSRPRPKCVNGVFDERDLRLNGVC